MSGKVGTPSNMQGKGYSSLLHSVALSDSTPDPIPVIRKMASKGASLMEMSDATGLSKGQVTARIKKNGMVWNRKAGRPPSHD